MSPRRLARSVVWNSASALSRVSRASHLPLERDDAHRLQPRRPRRLPLRPRQIEPHLLRSARAPTPPSRAACAAD